MKLSIIVPVYNMVSGGKLVNCLDSLLSQKMTDYEIIAVDDKSTDDSLKVLKEYERKHPHKFKVIASPQNRRQGGAKNLGLKAATGEWLGFMDSDDWAAFDMFPKMIKKAEETGADVVGCDYLITDTIGKEEGIPVVNNTSRQTGILDEEKYKKLFIQPGSMVIKIYKRDIFTQNHLQFPEGIFYEDNAIGVFPMLYAKHFERVEECLYFYYQHNESTVHTISTSRCMDRVKASLIYARECKERGFYEKYKEEIDYKIFELGYRNTLFSYLQSTSRPEYKFVVQMQQFLKNEVPDYEKNSYFLEYMDAENQKLIALHLKNVRVFLIYYKLLNKYRQIRYGKNK